jgi:phage FluMu gp28-like protein
MSADLKSAVKEAGNPLDGGGDVGSLFLGYQARWVADESPVKVAEKSRRIGLTWAEAADSALLASRVDGMDTWYVGYNKDMAQEFIRDCGDWAKVYGLVAGEIEETQEVFKDGEVEKSILAFVIRFASGFRITALSSRPSNLRGKQGRVIIDEAAFSPELKELLKAALALLIWGGQVHIISTHDGDENEFNELIQEILAGKKPYGHHRITLDDALADGLYKRICRIRGIAWSAGAEAQWRADLIRSYGDGADEELFCIPSRGSGVWLSRVLIEARMADRPVVRWRAPEGMELWPDDLMEAEVASFCENELLPLLKQLDPGLRSAVGEDFGRHADLTVIAPLQVTLTLKRAFPFLVELANAPFKAQELIFFYICDRLPRFGAGKLDAGGNGAYLAEVAKQRYGPQRIEEVKFSEQWYRENTAPLKAAFEDGSIELPKDAAVLDDMAAFRMVRGVPRIPDIRVADARGQKRHGDAGIAVLLAYAAARQDYVPMEGQGTGRLRVHTQLDGFMD